MIESFDFIILVPFSYSCIMFENCLTSPFYNKTLRMLSFNFMLVNRKNVTLTIFYNKHS